jgi:hypothetical protein
VQAFGQQPVAATTPVEGAERLGREHRRAADIEQMLRGRVPAVDGVIGQRRLWTAAAAQPRIRSALSQRHQPFGCTVPSKPFRDTGVAYHLFVGGGVFC